MIILIIQKKTNMEKKLQALGSNHAGVLRFTNGNTGNYGSIRVENGNFYCYTGQGLREMFPQSGATEKSKELNKLSEAELIKLGHIAVIPVNEIAEIVH
jgi:hypothetical protein